MTNLNSRKPNGFLSLKTEPNIIMASYGVSMFLFFFLFILYISSDVNPYQDSKTINQESGAVIAVHLQTIQKDLQFPTTPSIVTVTPNPNSATPVSNPVTNPVTTPSQPITNPVTTFPAPSVTAPATVSSPAATGGSWCVAKNGAPESTIQAGIDYACGIGGADCSMIQEGGSCYNPNSIENHASCAFNSYYQKNPGQSSCDFGGAAIVTNVNPSVGSCIFPSSSSSSPSATSTFPGLGTNSSPMMNDPTPGAATVSSTGINPSSSSLVSAGSKSLVIGFVIVVTLLYHFIYL